MNSQMKMELFREVFVSNHFDASRQAVTRSICGLCTELMSSGVTKGFTSFALNVFDELTKSNSGTINIVIRTLFDTDNVEKALSFLKKQQVAHMIHYPLTLASMLYVTHYFY